MENFKLWIMNFKWKDVTGIFIKLKSIAYKQLRFNSKFRIKNSKFIIIFSLLLFNACFLSAKFNHPMDGINGIILNAVLLNSARNSSVTTVAPPSALTYSENPFVFKKGVAITPQTPTFTGTITSCNSSPLLPSGLSLNPTTCAISGTPVASQSNTTYSISGSNSGGSGVPVDISITVACNPCRMFGSEGSPAVSGSFGISSSDARCNGSGVRPDLSSKYKALKVGDTRRACITAYCSGGVSENKDWVFYPNTTYYRVNSTTIIGTTNSVGIFTFPLINSVSTGFTYFTGLSVDWTNDANNCNNWTGIGNGITGMNSANVGFINSAITSCGTGGDNICVEQ